MSYPYRSVAWALVGRHVPAAGVRNPKAVLCFGVALLGVGHHSYNVLSVMRSKREGREAAGHGAGCRVARREGTLGVHGT